MEFKYLDLDFPELISLLDEKKEQLSIDVNALEMSKESNIRPSSSPFENTTNIKLLNQSIPAEISSTWDKSSKLVMQ